MDNDENRESDGGLNLNRRDFLKYFGVTLGASTVGASFLDKTGLAAKTDQNVLTVCAQRGSLSGTLFPMSNIMRATHGVNNLLYNSLAKVNPKTGETEGDAAKSWEITDNGTTFTFDLREGIKFHNGEELTAADVKYSMEAILNEKWGLANRGTFAPIKEVKVLDPYKVKFKTSEPYSPWVTYTAGYWAIIPEGTLEKKSPDTLASDPSGVGSGPFRFEEWVPGDHCTVKKFDDYWREDIPKVDKVVFQAIPEQSTQYVRLKRGEVDILGQIGAKDFQGLKDSEGIQGLSVPDLSSRIVMYISFKKPLHNIHFRKAISYAVDRKSIANDILYGLATPSSVPAPPGAWFYNEDADYYRRDLDKAKEHLRKGGKPNGFSFDLMVSNVSPNLDTALVIQSNLKDVGINCNVQKVDPATFYPRISDQDYTAGLAYWTSAANPDYYFGSQFTTFGKYRGWSAWPKEQRKKVDPLVKESRKYVAQSERAPYYKEMQKILSEQAPWIWLGVKDDWDIWRKNVKNYTTNHGAGWIDVRETSIS